MFIAKPAILTFAPKDPVPVATKLVVLILPTVARPVTAKLVNVPVLVIFGCALFVTVLAVVAVVAVVADGTVPVTFAPVKLVKPLPLPINTPLLVVMSFVTSMVPALTPPETETSPITERSPGIDVVPS